MGELASNIKDFLLNTSNASVSLGNAKDSEYLKKVLTNSIFDQAKEA